MISSTSSRYFSGVLAVLVSVSALYVYSRHNRFGLLATPGGMFQAYKIDRQTGQVWAISYEQSEEVLPRKAASWSSPEEEAIALAKLFKFPNTSTFGGISTEDAIKQQLEGMKGPLRVDGWKAKKADEQTYIVGYLYDRGTNSNSSGWVFEVNLKAEIVRELNQDPDLAQHWADQLRNWK
jgi:hypothetical protein